MNFDEILKKMLGELLELCRRVFALAAFLCFLILAGLGWLLELWIVKQSQQKLPQELWYAGGLFLIGLLTNLTAACLIYSTLRKKIFRDFKALENEADQSVFATRMAGTLENSLRPALIGAVQTKLDQWKESRVEEYSLLNQPPWDDWIKAAKTIEICVQGMEDWVLKHSVAWDTFFNNNGTVKLFLPNPEDPEILRVIQERLPDRSEDDVKAEIKNTYRNLKRFQEERKTGKIIHYQLRKMNWYCAVRFGEHLLLLSVYEHFRVQQPTGSAKRGSNQEPHVKSPSYKVPLQEAAHAHTSRWIKKEFEGLARPEYSVMIEHPREGWDHMQGTTR